MLAVLLVHFLLICRLAYLFPVSAWICPRISPLQANPRDIVTRR